MRFLMDFVSALFSAVFFLLGIMAFVGYYYGDESITLSLVFFLLAAILIASPVAGLRPIRAGRLRPSVAIAAVGAGPDQRVGVAFFVVEEVGVDRGVEARIVELEAQIVAALVGALGPGGADLGAADQDPVAGSVLAGGALVGDDAYVLGLDAEGDDVAGELVRAALLEGADGRHCKSPFSVPEPHHCGLDGDRLAGGDRRRTPKGPDS